MKQLFYPVLAIAMYLSGGQVYGQVPINSNPCNALEIIDCRVGTNVGAMNDPAFAVPICLGLQNTVYFKYQIPAGHSNFKTTLIPNDTTKHSVVYMVDDCLSPSYSLYYPSAACADAPGDTVRTGLSIGCLGSGTSVLIRVSGDEGGFQLCVEPTDPNCSDGCLNGNEIEVDSIAPPDVVSNLGVDRICSGDTLILTVVGDTSSYANIAWSTGSAGNSIVVTDIGAYTVFVLDTNGCSSHFTKIIRADTSCVWPGETNLDGKVNARDLIPVGWAFDNTGPARPSTVFPLSTFTGVPSSTWSDGALVPRTLPGVFNGVNLKHVDANGDGTINELDLTPIQDFYGGVVFYRMGSMGGEAGDPPIFFTFNKDSIEVGDTLKTTIHLGTSSIPASDVYSWWLSIGFDGHLVDTGYFEIDFENSWLKDSTQDISFTHQESGFLDISFSRTNGNGVSGYGPIVEFEVIIIDNLDGRLEKMSTLHFDWLAAEVFDPNLNFIDTDPLADSVQLWEFCYSEGLSSASEWIKGVNISGKKFITGNSGGYAFTEITTHSVIPGQNMWIAGLADFPGPLSDTVDWLVNADFDHSNSFEITELIAKTTDINFMYAPFTIPPDATPGPVLIRVQMSKKGSQLLDPCEDVLFGEVEDYLIYIVTTPKLSGGDEAELLLNLSPNPPAARTHLEIAGRDVLGELNIRILNIHGIAVTAINIGGVTEKNHLIELDVENLPGGLYTVEVNSNSGAASTKLMMVR